MKLIEEANILAILKRSVKMFANFLNATAPRKLTKPLEIFLEHLQKVIDVNGDYVRQLSQVYLRSLVREYH